MGVVKMRYIVAGLTATIAAAVQLAACSRPVTSLESDKMLMSIGVEGRRTYCRDQLDYRNAQFSKGDMQKIRCGVAAKVIAESGRSDTARARAACQRVYQVCLATPEPEPEPQSSCDTFVRDAEECAATVGEASECVEAQVDALGDLASEADTVCEDVGRASERARDQETSSKLQPCTRLHLLCPNVLVEPLLGGKGR